MFDNVTFKIFDLPRNQVLSNKVKIIYQRSIDTYEGQLGNMSIKRYPKLLLITGSLAKYLNNENITPLSRVGVKQSIKKLEQDIGISLKNAIVTSVEFGTSIILKEKSFEYLYLFGNAKRLKKNDTFSHIGLETVTYFSKTGSVGFIIYDKINEMKDKKQDIPFLYKNTNVLRLEYKIRKRRGIQAKFKRDLTAYNLFNAVIYKRFKELFLDTYNQIEKMGRLVFVDKSNKISAIKIRKLQAEQYRQSNYKDYIYSIQKLLETGKISINVLKTIKAENRKLGNNVSVSNTNKLVKELNAYVYDSVRFGA